MSHRHHTRLALVFFSTAALAACHKRVVEDDLTADNWSCQKLVQPIIDMSKDRDIKILEIAAPQEIGKLYGSYIKCTGTTEMSRGNGYLEYGAHVSQEGAIILEYSIK